MAETQATRSVADARQAIEAAPHELSRRLQDDNWLVWRPLQSISTFCGADRARRKGHELARGDSVGMLIVASGLNGKACRPSDGKNSARNFIMAIPLPFSHMVAGVCAGAPDRWLNALQKWTVLIQPI